MHVHAQRAVVAHHQHRVADLLEQRGEAPGLEGLAGYGEVRAVAKARGLVLGAVQRRRRVVVLELGVGVAAQGGQAAGDHHGEAVGAGVDHARLAQDGQLLGTALHRLLAGLERVLEHLGQQLVLLRRGGVGTEAAHVHVGEVVGHPAGHCAHRGQHRSLGGVAHRGVGGVGRAREGGRHEYRVDELAGTRGELLRRAAHDLGEDHARVPTRPQQGGAGHRADDLVAAAHVEWIALHAVELLEDRAQGEGHVVARVAVGDREHVQVVDLLAAVLQLRQGSGQDTAETDEALVGHWGFVHLRAVGATPRRRDVRRVW